MPTVRQRLTSAWRGLRFAGVTGLMAGPYGMWPLMGYNPDDYAVTLDDLQFSSAVMSCVQWIMRTIPQAPAVVRQTDPEGEDAVIVGHPLVDLLALPNPYYSGDLLMQATAMSWCLYGNAYWLVMRDRMGVDRELWWEPPNTIRPHFPDNGSQFIDYYEVMRNGKWEVQVPPRDVVHFRHSLDMVNGRMGYPPLISALRDVFTDQEASVYTAALLHRTGVPSVVISPMTPDARVSQEQADEIKRTYQERFTGANRGDALVMRGPSKIDVLTFNPEQMNLDKVRQFVEARIAGLLGIPAIVAGLEVGLEHATYSNFAEARRQAWDDCIIPMQTAFGRSLTTQLLPDFAPEKGVYVGYDYRKIAILQEDQNALYTRLSAAYTAGWLKRSDARRMANLPVDDAADDVYRSDLTPAAPAVGSGANSEPPLRAVAHIVERPQLKGGDGYTALPVGSQWQYWNAGKVAAKQRLLTTKAVTDVGWKSLSDDLSAVVENVSPGFAADLTRVLVALGREAAKEMRPFLKSVESDSMMASVIAVGTILHMLRRAYEDAYDDIDAQTASAIADALELRPEQLARPDLVRGLRAAQAARLESFASDLTGQTAAAIIAAVHDGLASGLTEAQIARQIRSYVSGSHLYPGIAKEAGDAAATAHRADVIARTETAIARNHSTIAAYESSQVVGALKVTDGLECGWITHDDPLKADGMIVSFEQARSNPIAHPNCVRQFLPQITE